MTSSAAANRRQPPPPPPTIDVRKYANSRAAELDSLHTIISNRLDNDFRSRRNKRRRTTSFAPKNRHRGNREERENEEKKLPRRVRRRMEMKKNPELGFIESGDGTKRLRTHVWHAKRFTMTKVWGFYLPLGLHGSGRGSRALLKWYKQGAVVHDASYYSAVQLEGSQEELLSIMSSVLVPPLMDYSEDISQRVLRGDDYGSAMFNYTGKDGSRAICPVTYMWRPFNQMDNGVGTKTEGNDEKLAAVSSPPLRQIWIWMHPSAFAEGFDCLKLICQKMVKERGVLVDCVSLHGKLARLEVMGQGAFKLLQKILHPFTPSYLENTLGLKNCSTVGYINGHDINQKGILEKEEGLSSHGAVSLKVVDPRLLSQKGSAVVLDSHLASNINSVEKQKNNECLGENQHSVEEVTCISQSKHEEISLSDCKDLWDASIGGFHPPLEEHLLCQEKHERSMDFFCLKETSLAKTVSTEEKPSKLCPIVLLRNNYQEGQLSGWSIVLPLNWVKAFWIPMVSGGAHAIGLRERHWISCDVGLPYFPSDFPDCNAYSSYMAREAAAVDQTMERRPLAMRSLKVPLQLPWNSSCFLFDEDVQQETGTGFPSNTGANGGHSADVDSEVCDVPATSSCDVFVARTSIVLTSFLKEISCDHLLLLPKGLNSFSFSHFMKDDTTISQASVLANLTSRGNRLCYLRVHLHAFKEGVFDEGAVVCAPCFSDISVWTSRSENDEGLHVPNSFVGSYFKELSSGKWEFQLPEDPAAREAYRRPLGFVTTGFVRGSKRPSAVALCEAVLLARLRHEQWSQIPAKRRRKEIFVLVRNLRSTAYRLALATIVLEAQDKDVDFL